MEASGWGFSMSIESRIRYRYLNALVFRKLSIFRAVATVAPKRAYPCFWIVVGPGLPWLGESFDTWQEAMDYVNDQLRHNR